MIAQIAIMIFGASAIWLVGRKEHWKRWGYILGIIGQPFWFYTAYTNEQWGILIMCLFYFYAWLQGIYNHWIKVPKKEQFSDLFKDFNCFEIHRPNIPDDGCKTQCRECYNEQYKIKIEDFHIGFKYEEYEMDSERYLNRGMIWKTRTYTLTSPRLHKIKKLIEEGKIRKI